MSTLKIAVQPYKGTRDFYPDEMRFRKLIFQKISDLVEKYGYEPYDGPMLESFDLYAAKTGEEIVNEQLYSFEDRGGRKVAMRPEMTPTLARMVAKKAKELVRPIRWYSIPNLWRYENPQKGRLREHWQLNVDIFGVDGSAAEAEVLALAIEILKGFGANATMFELRLNHRMITDTFLHSVLKLDSSQLHTVAKLIDKKLKMDPSVFEKALVDIGLNLEQNQKLLDFFSLSLAELRGAFPELEKPSQQLEQTFFTLSAMGYGEYVRFVPEIMRGFDYYTGMVFEIFDKHPENRRSIFGGGRYDNLLDLFGADSMSGIGFGMGDVTFADFLQTHGLTPDVRRENIVALGIFPDSRTEDLWRLAQELRESGIIVEIPWDMKKIPKQIQSVEKKGIRYFLLLGEAELSENSVQLKDLQTGHQEKINRDQLLPRLREILMQLH